MSGSQCGIETTDLLSPNKFRIIIERFPTIEFFTQRVTIPSWNLGTVLQNTNREVDIKHPGDKLEYEDLIVSFLIDENLQGMQELHTWARAAVKKESADDSVFSDISIILQTANRTFNQRIIFYNCFPYNSSPILLDATVSEDQALSADVMFKYTHFDYT